VARAVGLGGGAAQAIEDEQPGLVISCGFSGGLERSLTPGTPILASAVHDELGSSIAAPAALLQAVRRVLDITVGDILCTTQVAATRDEKRALARAGLLAVDLESWPAARAAQQAGIPWLALRVILDPLETDLPAFTRNPHGGYVGAGLLQAARVPKAAL
jgi:adenosylhomocysteine nucleosidase